MMLTFEEKKRDRLTPKEYEEIHHQLMTQVAATGLGGMLGRTQPFFRADIPQDFTEAALAENPRKTPDDIANEWWAGRSLELWNKYHGTNSKARMLTPRPSIPATQVSLQVPVPTSTPTPGPAVGARTGPYGIPVPGSAEYQQFLERVIKSFREGTPETGEETVREAP
jgi:hypothetical protein